MKTKDIELTDVEIVKVLDIYGYTARETEIFLSSAGRAIAREAQRKYHLLMEKHRDPSDDLEDGNGEPCVDFVFKPKEWRDIEKALGVEK